MSEQAGKPVSNEELKRMILEMMDAVHAYCEQNGLTYYMAYGTLLGAVRHEGFIPWDDDFDIWMPRKDYERFLDGFSKLENSPFRLISPQSDPAYYCPFAKVYDTRTSLIEHISHPCEIGVYIDVFPLDNCPGDEAAVRQYIDRINTLRKRIVLKSVLPNKKRGAVKNGALRIGKALLSFTSENTLARKIDDMAKWEQNEDSEYIVNLVIRTHKDYEIFRREWFENRKLVPFEDRTYYIPCEYDLVLKEVFGDYMQLPPKEKQVTHHGFDVYYK